MSRVIYSLYVDIPAEEHYGNSTIKFDTTEKASVVDACVVVGPAVVTDVVAGPASSQQIQTQN